MKKHYCWRVLVPTLMLLFAGCVVAFGQTSELRERELKGPVKFLERYSSLKVNDSVRKTHFSWSFDEKENTLLPVTF